MLRKILRDPRWSLPSWPDAERRIRRRARRQRLSATGAAAGLSAAAVLAVALPAAHLGGSPPAVQARAATAYVLSQRLPDSTVTAIDTATSRPIRSIKIPGGNGIAISKDRKTAYVGGSGGLTPISIATSKAGRLIKVPGGIGAGILLTPNGKTAYVTDDRSGVVVPVNLATRKVEKPTRVVGEILAMAVTPNGRTVYVLSSNFVTPISTATNTAGTPIRLGTQPTDIAITPGGRTAYVAMGSSVVLISTVTNTVLKSIRFPKLTVSSITITPNGKIAYASMNGQVVPIRTATSTALRPIRFGRGALPDQVAITPDGKTGYVVVAPVGGDFVTPFSTATNTKLRPIRTGKNPFMIAITPDGKTACVANLGNFSVAPTLARVDTATGTVGRVIRIRQLGLIVINWTDIATG